MILALAGTVSAAEHIHDEAGLFSRETVSAAERQIAALERQHRHGVTIETFETVSAGRRAEFEKMSASEKNRFYSEWLEQRARKQRAEGLFILVTKEPRHVQVGVSSRLRAAGFTDAAKQDVLQTLLADFKENRYDSGLTAALEKVERRYAQLHSVSPTTRPVGSRPAAAPGPTQRASGWSVGTWLIIAAVIIGGMMLLSRLGRSTPASYGPGGGTGYPSAGPGGGGGFLGNMMGGLFGAMAGNWLYDSFSGRSAHAGDQSSAGPPRDYNSDTSGETWDSSGGSFDDGGDDFSGGFGGGGDFGGGDDSNSSGGDF